MSESRKGIPAWNKGKTGYLSEEQRARISAKNRSLTGPNANNWKGGVTRPKCLDCGVEITYGHKHCVKHAHPKGPLAPTWKGGVTPLMMAIRNCPSMREWRRKIFVRDNYTCRLCGQRGGTLHADHFPKSFADIFYENEITTLNHAIHCAEFWDITNGRTLCVLCHRKNTTWSKKRRSVQVVLTHNSSNV